MDKLAEAMDRLDRLRFPSDISFDREGSALAATVRPASREKGQSYQSRIWRFGLDGTAKQLTDGPNGDGLPRYSPVDGRLAFTSDRSVKGKADLFILDDGAVKPLGTSPGRSKISAGQATAPRSWCSPPIAASMAAQPTVPSASPGETKRIRPSTSPTTARRRLFKVDATSGATIGGRSRRAQRLGVPPARRRRCDRARLGRSERARLVSQPHRQARLRRRGPPRRFINRSGSCCRLRHRLRGRASPSSRAGRAIAGLSRARSAFSISRPASVTTIAAADGVGRDDLRVAGRG